MICVAQFMIMILQTYVQIISLVSVAFFFAYFAQLRFKLFKVASKPNEENNNTLMRVEWTLITARCEVKVQKPARINDTKKSN